MPLIARQFSRFLASVGLLLTMGFYANIAVADIAALETFFGHYKGIVYVEGETDELSREVDVNVYHEGDENFRLDWTTIIYRDGEEDKTSTYSIHFRPSDQENTFASAMRKNMFGRWVPLDPLKGDPYVWARLKDKTLTVYALIITEDGGYEMQQYDRTVRSDGDMDLVFTRIRDGVPLKTIRGVLNRIKE